MQKIFEQIFQEATKRRFIEPAWKDLEWDTTMRKTIMRDSDYPDRDFPEVETIIKWVDSGAADKYNIIWPNLKSSDEDKKYDEIGKLISAFYKYYDNGGSVKDRKALARNDVKQIFRGHRVTFCEKGDCSGYDMALVGENDKFVFVAPLTQIGAEWMDSFECGGEGARWCIGTADDDYYWKGYLYDNTWFILALNKAAYATPADKRKPDTLKYMIQLAPESGLTQAWKQSDDPDETIPISDFGHVFGKTAVELGELFALNIAHSSTDYSNYISRDMYNFESGEFRNPWSEYALRSEKLYLSDFYSGKLLRTDVEEQIKRLRCITIDCEGEEFHPEKFTGIANSLVKNPGEIYDSDSSYKILDLTGFIRSFNGGDYIHLTFINGKFDCILVTGNTEVDVYFEGCEISKLYYYKHQRDNGKLEFIHGTEIEDVYWGSEEEFFTCNIDNVKFGTEPCYEWFLPEEEENM